MKPARRSKTAARCRLDKCVAFLLNVAGGKFFVKAALCVVRTSRCALADSASIDGSIGMQPGGLI